MKRCLSTLLIALSALGWTACSTSYKAQPLAFKAPNAYTNAVIVEGATWGAKAFDISEEAKKAFGFDILGAGMLPVQVVIDNPGSQSFEINSEQTFLEDSKGNLWPILSAKIAYERAAKYSKTKEIAKESAYKGFLGAAAGGIIGAAVGIVTGEDVGKAAGKGAAAGAATGAIVGGAIGYGSDEARRSITTDLREKSLENKPIQPKSLSHGILFFPGEAGAARHLRLQIRERTSGQTHIVKFAF